MPRLMTSLPSSLGVQCVTGRPLFSGGSHATARIAATCSAVNLPGQPGRGKSLNTSPMAARKPARPSMHSISTNLSKALAQRRRHMATVWRSHSKSSAMSSLFHRSKPSKIISARCANPCGHWRDRESVRRTSCCRSVMIIFVAFPGMTEPSASLVTCATRIRCQIPAILGRPFQPGCSR